jgi:hypothetical protein
LHTNVQNMPRYKSRVGKKRRGGSIATGQAASMVGGSIKTGGGLSGNVGASASAGPVSGGANASFNLKDYKPLPTHLAAAHAVLATPSKTWRLVQHAAALHGGAAGSPFYPHITKGHIS